MLAVFHRMHDFKIFLRKLQFKKKYNRRIIKKDMKRQKLETKRKKNLIFLKIAINKKRVGKNGNKNNAIEV